MIIEDLDYERIFAEKLDRFTSEYQRVYPTFERPTPADPMYRMLAELSLSELLIREKINAAGWAQLLKYSSDLEFVTAGRLAEGEGYESYRDWLQKNLSLASPAGSLPMYAALTYAVANQGIKEKAGFRVLDSWATLLGDEIVVFLLPNESAEDSDDPLDLVRKYFERPDSKNPLDLVRATYGTARSVNISASFRLRPGQGQSALALIEADLRRSWARVRRLGWGPTLSWLTKELHADSVLSARLKTPIEDAVFSMEEYAQIGSLRLTLESP